jgi:site-specific recombinase
MGFHLKTWFDRFAGRHGALPSLDLLASSASAKESLESRLNWLVDLGRWIRRPGQEAESLTSPVTQIQAGRLRRFFDVLDRNPAWKLSVARTLRSIIRETSAFELFCRTGLPRQFGLLSEAGGRLAQKMLPSPPGSAELGALFGHLFPYRRDDVWIAQLDEATLQRFRALLEFETAPEEKDWNTLAEDLEDALFHLAAQLRVSGSSTAVRSRVERQNVRELPLFQLNDALQTVFAAQKSGAFDALVAEMNCLHLLLERCHRMVDEVFEHLEKRGVGAEVVYQLAFIEASLGRFEALLELQFSPERPLTRIGAFVAMLVRENQARESVIDLLRQNFRLLTRKIVERNADTGEHYIVRTPQEYAGMLKSAAGGGAIMAFTTWIKTIILGWHLPGFLEGLAASVNYATGFVVIQLTGSTLATKQPANTAAALAARMHDVRNPAALEGLVDEIVWLIRSQFASIVGNLALVVPTVLALHFLILRISGAPMLSHEKAVKSIQSVSLLGPSLLFAGLTGVFLWASSLIAAWTDNWFVFNQIGEALHGDRRLIRVLGATRAAGFARFWKKNIAGLAGNISFGLMLGMVPAFAAFAGLPVEIRHVTLSSSLLAAAAASLGPGVLSTGPFWLGAAGIVAIGLMNVGISFSLALLVAVKARGIRYPEVRLLCASLLRRLHRQPLAFILPEPHARGGELGGSA